MMLSRKVRTKIKLFETNLRVALCRNRDHRKIKTHPIAFISRISIGLIGGYERAKAEKSF